MSDLEAEKAILAIFCKYLLLERKQETQLSMAYAIMAQERHNTFHTTGNKNSGDGTEFSDCSNEVCKMAFAVLQDSRRMAVEINDLTVQLTSNYSMKLESYENRTARAWLETKIHAPEEQGIESKNTDNGIKASQ